MADTELAPPFVVTKWAGLDNYECNVVENGINCPWSIVESDPGAAPAFGFVNRRPTALELMRQHLWGHGISLLEPEIERPRFSVGLPVADREAEEVVAPPPPLPAEIIEPAPAAAEPNNVSRRRKVV